MTTWTRFLILVIIGLPLVGLVVWDCELDAELDTLRAEQVLLQAQISMNQNEIDALQDDMLFLIEELGL